MDRRILAMKAGRFKQSQQLLFERRAFVRYSAVMVLDFTKMNGAGNDFVLIDNRARSLRLTKPQIARICDRQRGVGADGLLLLVPCESRRADWAWQFYNNDGSTAEMCGNGARCFARFIQRHTDVKERTTFETGAGIITATFLGHQVSVGLTPPRELVVEQKISLRDGTQTIHSINTGVPHAVLFVEDADQAMVGPIGSEVRHHRHFAPKGTNVNFVQVKGPSFIQVRTYERGVEGETLACGTGVTAAALLSARVHGFQSPVKIQVQSGEFLEVSFQKEGNSFGGVTLTGPAEFVFDGRIEIPD